MDLTEHRREIDTLDRQIMALFVQRMALVRQIAEYKRGAALPVPDAAREREKLRMAAESVPPELRGDAMALCAELMRLSRAYQERSLRAANTEKLHCGLLGERLGHSYSPEIHAMLADYEYKLCECAPDAVEHFVRDGALDGFNVTIPYKKTVAALCDELSDTARRLGSVNTVIRRADGSIYGDNTDAFGFESLVRHSGIDVCGKRAVVLGSGGASVTVCAMLEKLGAASVRVLSRGGGADYGDITPYRDAQIIVNATPVGMYPKNGAAAVDLRDFPQCEGVLDLVYNPARTALIMQAETLDIRCESGLYMLVAQAKRSSELFTGSALPDGEIPRICGALARNMRNIVIIGMPGSGKTTVAAALGKMLGRPVYDSDDKVLEMMGESAEALIRARGEAEFRRAETAALAELGRLSGAVIATGGGVVTREENYPLLHQNGIIVRLKRALAHLPTDGRPVSQATAPAALCAAREPMYARFADVTVDNNGALEETLRAVINAAG